jgi:hypothetical protein
MNIQDVDVLKDKALQERSEIFSRADAGEVVRFEVDHYRKDGSIFPLSVTISKINIDGEYYLLFHQDITERKEAEAVVRKKIADLEWFNSMSVGRELKMIELKKEINELLKRLGEDSKYEIYM